MNNPKKELAIVSRKVRKYRKEKGLSQDRLAKKADVAFHTIVKLESGDTSNPMADTLKSIADALEVSVDDLLNE
ncbi:helix-turn-helix domain-containing protein [Patescibacteria group bacterium]|nr:helix-turn-helix domain-containing protein [Patescibacteria group bacterium]